MGKSKKRTISTIVTMIFIAVVIVLLYYYISTKTEPFDETSVENLSDVEKLLAKDLDQNYPETPREVVKLYSSMLKTLYTASTDEEVKSLALKMRDLYDDEFLKSNPEEEYLNNLYSEIAQWKDANRKITNYLLEDKEQKNEIDGRQYADEYVSYTFDEKGKFSEIWRFLLRLSEDGKWKILGWEYSPEDSTQ
jgi:hypothetical protein